MTHHTGSDEGLSEAEREAAFATIERLVAEAHERGYSLDALLAQTYAAAAAPDALRDARDEGIRQAIEWLRADYEYGTGPDWREAGAEWIAQRAAEERAALAERPTDGATT